MLTWRQSAVCTRTLCGRYLLRAQLAHSRSRTREKQRNAERDLETLDELDLGLKITRAKDYRVFIPRITSIPRISQLMFSALSIYSTEHHDKNTQNKRNRTHQLCLARLHSLSVQLCSIWVYATLTAVLYKWFQLMYSCAFRSKLILCFSW